MNTSVKFINGPVCPPSALAHSRDQAGKAGIVREAPMNGGWMRRRQSSRISTTDGGAALTP
jgi:hypothetical protein